MTKHLAIDPGLHYSGFCVMSSDLRILEAGCVHHKGPLSWDARLPLVMEDVMAVYRRHLPDTFVFEVPEHWSGREGFAARESGSVFKLTFLAGALYGVVKHQCLSEMVLLTPSKWKGQMPKDLVHKRLIRKVPEASEYTDHNVLDAIALAYVSFRGKL